MRYLLLLCLFWGSQCNGQLDSISSSRPQDSVPPLLMARHSLSLITFPALETGVLYQRRVSKRLKLGASAYLFHFPESKPVGIRRVDLPLNVSDTALIYRESYGDSSKYNFRIGFEIFPSVGLLAINNGPQIVLSYGLDFTFGAFEVNHTYTEFSVPYTTDSITGSSFYLDVDGQATQDPLLATGHNLLLAQSRWRYQTYGLMPSANIHLASRKRGISAGVRLVQRLQFYHLRSSSVNDPRRILAQRPSAYHKNQFMLYLMVSFHLP